MVCRNVRSLLVGALRHAYAWVKVRMGESVKTSPNSAAYTHLVDTVEHSVKRIVDLVIPEAKYPEAQAFEYGISLRVAPPVSRRGVLAPIQLHDDLLFEAHKVDDVPLQRYLPSKLNAELTSA